MVEHFDKNCSLYPGWEVDKIKNIREFYTDVDNLYRHLDIWLWIDSLGYVNIDNISLSVEIVFKDRPKPIGLTDQFWIDVATGNIDYSQL